MKKHSSNIKWLVVSVTGLICLYFMYTNELYTDANLHSWYKNGSELQSINQNSRVISENIILKTDDLWRSLDNVNSSVDKVLELMKWTENISQSEYLKNARPKRVLVFNGISNYYGTEEGNLKCPFNNSALLTEKCFIKEDKLLDVTNYGGYDAFVYVRNWNYVIYDRKISSAKSKVVFYIQESPFVAKYADLSTNDAILASYFRGSDIVLPYGYFSKFQDPSQSQKENLNKINYAEGKSQLAAIIVSNCEAKNDRLQYVKELQQYIPVHVYGACGPYKCLEFQCLERVKKEYKFYLAFEKANCKDYITEKFWYNALEHNAIPVVMGAHPLDYRDLAPPNSYIHVENFKSPKEVADYIIKLDKNDTLYNEYFNWKSMGKLVSTWQEFFCRLCGLLFFADFKPPPVWKPNSSWKSINHCLPIKKWYWTRDS